MMRYKLIAFPTIWICLFFISVPHVHAVYNYYLPLFRSQPDYWSGLGITNLHSPVPANITVTVYNKGGTSWVTETKTIPAGGQESFMVEGGSISQGWIKITSDQRLAGMNLLGEYVNGTTDYYLADVPFTEVASKFLLIPHVAQNPKWDTTVYMANTESSPGSITLTYINKSGDAGTPYEVTIPGNGTREIPVSTIGSSTSIYGGYVTIKSNKELTAFALYNNLKTGNYSYAGINAVDSTHSCGAYVAPGVWKEFDCYNLAAIGKTTNDDPFVPSWRLIGGYWQWGRKGPDTGQWYDTNTPDFAHGPTGPDAFSANDGAISGWDQTDVPAGSWSDTAKTDNDPCPAGFRVPTRSQWAGVRNSNTQSTAGSSWSSSATNYSSAIFFGDDLMLPASGTRDTSSGSLHYRGVWGIYWSSSYLADYNAWDLVFDSSYTGESHYLNILGLPVRCVAE